MQISITKIELYTMMKEAVRDVLHEERMNLFLESIPEVSEEEMNDIISLYGKPGPRIAARTETIDI